MLEQHSLLELVQTCLVFNLWCKWCARFMHLSMLRSIVHCSTAMHLYCKIFTFQACILPHKYCSSPSSCLMRSQHKSPSPTTPSPVSLTSIFFQSYLVSISSAIEFTFSTAASFVRTIIVVSLLTFTLRDGEAQVETSAFKYSIYTFVNEVTIVKENVKDLFS
jgi:hypothetical protein